jgi:hypothetical protein
MSNGRFGVLFIAPRRDIAIAQTAISMHHRTYARISIRFNAYFVSTVLALVVVELLGYAHTVRCPFCAPFCPMKLHYVIVKL